MHAGGVGAGLEKTFPEGGQAPPSSCWVRCSRLSRSASELSDLLKEQVCLLIYWVSILMHSEPSMAGQNQHPLGAW